MVLTRVAIAAACCLAGAVAADAGQSGCSVDPLNPLAIVCPDAVREGSRGRTTLRDPFARPAPSPRERRESRPTPPSSPRRVRPPVDELDDLNRLVDQTLAQADGVLNDPSLDPQSRRALSDAVGWLRQGRRSGFGLLDQPDEGFRFEGTQYMDMFFESAQQGFHMTGGKEPGHNKGSLHGKGRAIDVRTRDKTNREIDRYMLDMQRRGYRVRDERTHPPGQKVWKGPHLHLSAPRRNEPNYNLGIDYDLTPQLPQMPDPRFTPRPTPTPRQRPEPPPSQQWMLPQRTPTVILPVASAPTPRYTCPQSPCAGVAR